MFKESNDKELVQLEPKSQNLLIGLGKHRSMEGDWHLNCYIIQPVIVNAEQIDTTKLITSQTKQQQTLLSPIRMRKKYSRVNILRCVFILGCANQPESKFKLRSHGFYRQEYFCR